jgi:2-dehydropantoate 2-reductase
MRYVIIGAGAIGGALGARLGQSSPDRPPLLIARGDHGAAIRSSGLRLRTPDEDVVVRVDSAEHPAEVALQADDVLVFATKTQQLEAGVGQWVDQPVHAKGDAAGRIVGTAGELLPALTLLNGVAAERIALRYFQRVFGVCIWLPSVHLIPGEVVIRIGPSSGTFIMGRYGAAADDADRELLGLIQQDWQASTFRVHVVKDVMRWKYSKLIGNLANAIQALLGPDGASQGDLAGRVRNEAAEILTECGITWASEEEEEAWRGDDFRNRPIPGFEGELGGSSWQSMARRSGSIESDFLNGEVAYLARTIGRTAPINAGLQRIARQAATRGSTPGSMTIEQLEAELARA